MLWAIKDSAGLCLDTSSNVVFSAEAGYSGYSISSSPSSGVPVAPGLEVLLRLLQKHLLSKMTRNLFDDFYENSHFSDLLNIPV